MCFFTPLRTRLGEAIRALTAAAAAERPAYSFSGLVLSLKKLVASSVRVDNAVPQRGQQQRSGTSRRRPNYDNSKRSAKAKRAAARRRPRTSFRSNGSDRGRVIELTELDCCYCCKRVCFRQFGGVSQLSELHEYLLKFWSMPKLHQDLTALPHNKRTCSFWCGKEMFGRALLHAPFVCKCHTTGARWSRRRRRCR